VRELLFEPHLDKQPEDFFGRQLELWQVLQNFGGPRRVVCVHGESGIGKTAFARFLARFVHTPGRLFQDGVLYDPDWPARQEPLPWLALETAWKAMGVSSWDREQAGFQPNRPYDELFASLRAELSEDPRRWLLIVDDADSRREGASMPKVKVGALEQHLADLLDHSNVTLLLTAKQPWKGELLGGFKVMNIPLRPLDELTSVKLFMQRIHRPLGPGDFLEPMILASMSVEPEGEPAPARRRVVATAEEREAHRGALLQHPLLKELGGHPAKIREAAARVTPGLQSLHELLGASSSSDRPPRARPRHK